MNFATNTGDIEGIRTESRKRKSEDNIEPGLKSMRLEEPTSSKINSHIKLTETEERICNLLVKVTDFMKEKYPSIPHIQLRIAGGWVRDKLLGKDSHDIDIAVDFLSGFEMAKYVNEYLEIHGQSAKKVSKIQQNPARSKHLETATTMIYGTSVDFVNLRSESYNEDSRIPHKVEFGTPLEDALRRDITINSLFYNIADREVEDYTGHGLNDLAEGVIRTPITPFETFRDDPLRVLRVIRFASRYRFKLVDQIGLALNSEDIKRDFRTKISKERIGDEITKILEGNTQIEAIELIENYGWYFTIFQKPERFNCDNHLESYLAVSVSKNINLIQEKFQCTFDKAQLKILYMAAFLFPYYPCKYERLSKTHLVVPLIIKGSIKLSSHDSEHTKTIFRAVEKVMPLANKKLDKTDPKTRVELGLIIRTIGPLWHLAILFTAAVEMTLGKPTADVFSEYTHLIDTVTQLGLDNAYSLKHVLDGKAVSVLLKLKPGPQIKETLDVVMEWQLEHPTGTAEECKKHILALKLNSDS